MNESIPVENNAEDIILNTHVGVSSRELMRPVWRGTTSQQDEGAECKSGYGFIAGEAALNLGLSGYYASAANICENTSRNC